MYWQSKHHIGHAKLSFEWRIPTYKQLLNTQSSCKKLYIIKQNYMHIKHPIYSFKLRAQGWSSPNLSLELQRATSEGPAGLTAWEQTKVSTDARLESFLWVTHFKNRFHCDVWLAHWKQATFSKPHFPVHKRSPYMIINELNSELRQQLFPLKRKSKARNSGFKNLFFFFFCSVGAFSTSSLLNRRLRPHTTP